MADLTSFASIFILFLWVMGGRLLIAAPPVNQKTMTPILQTSDSVHVMITHPALEAKWDMMSPEAVASDRVLLFYPPDFPILPVTWKTCGDGSIGYDWRPRPESRPARKNGMDFYPGISLSMRLRPSNNRIDVSISFTNLTSRTLERVSCDGGCLGSLTEKFRDRDHMRSFIKTSQGIIRLADTQRSAGIRCRYVFDPRWYEYPLLRSGESFWGRSVTTPTSAFIGRSAVGGGAVGIGFESAFELMQNSDEQHHCLHSGPWFGSLKPGETQVRRGVILFGDRIGDLFKQFEALDYRPVSASDGVK